MSNELFTNNPPAALATTVSTTPAAGTVETWSVTVQSGISWPTFTATNSQFRCLIGTELILVTAGTTTVGTQSWTVTRGIEGSSVATHPAGAVIALQITSAQATRMAPRNYLYLPGGWDDAWQAAKAAATTTPAQIMFLGDSIQVGVLATDWKNGYPHLIREALKAGLGGLHADYFPSTGYSSIPAFACPGTPPWSNDVGTGAVQNNSNAFGWHYTMFDSNATEPTTYYHQTFTSPDACTDLDLFYVDFNSGTFKYSVDGGADQTVTCTNAANNAIAPVVKIQAATGLASATHTLALGKQSAANVAIPMGVAIYPTGRSGGGLSIARFCAGLTNFVDYAAGTAGQHPTNRLELLSGPSPMSGSATVSSPRSFGFPTQTHLAVIALGVNDCNGSKSTTDFENALRRTIQSIRRGQANASILLHIVSNPDADSSDITSGFVPANWPTYMASFYRYAELYNCAILNTHAKCGETPGANGFLTSANNVHPTNAGHADIANDLLAIL